MKLEHRCRYCMENIFSIKNQLCQRAGSRKHEWTVVEVQETEAKIEPEVVKFVKTIYG